jgi:hydrogenase expression/formation protein HypC
MCLAVPGKILSIDNSIAVVDIQGNRTEADISLVEGVAVGDYVIVHAGLAIERYDEKEALETLAMLRELADGGRGE